MPCAFPRRRRRAALSDAALSAGAARRRETPAARLGVSVRVVGDRDPLLARTQIEIVRTLLANAEHDDTFAILTADTQVQAFAPSPQRATPENVAAAVAFLEKAHLVGALDLDAGLTTAAELLHNSENPVLVHLGCGLAALGERRADVLAGRIPASGVLCRRRRRQARIVGVHAPRRRTLSGYVTQINPDEPVAWRAFDLLATLNTPRLMGVRVADIEGKTRFLCPTSTVAQGEELCAVTRLPADAPLPQSVCVTGMLDGTPFRAVLGVDSPRPDADYLPRTWAKLEIDRLLAEDAVKNKDAIIALSKAMYVMTPFTSLLVLENEAMYAQYKVDRGRKDHWAMYPCPPKIPVVSEWPPEPSEPWEHPPYIIRLEVVPIIRAASSVESDAQLKERIRQENRRRWMMNPYQGYLSGAADIARAPGGGSRKIQQAKLLRQNAIRSSLETRASP